MSGPRRPPAWAFSASALHDRESNVRVATAYALCEIGPDARNAVPALKEAFKEKNGDLKTAIDCALKAIEGKK